MPKTVVEEVICDICGAEVRDGSLFCYNCGGSVTTESAAIPAPAEPVVSSGEEPSNGSSNYDPTKRRSERIEKRKVRAANRQPTEIVWEPRTGVSWPFVITSLVFVLIVFGVILLAFYFR